MPKTNKIPTENIMKIAQTNWAARIIFVPEKKLFNVMCITESLAQTLK